MISVSLRFKDGKIINLNFAESLPFFFCSGEEDLVSCVIQGNANSIPPFAFEGCTQLNHLKIPKSVVSICVSAFENCFALSELSLKGVKSYGPRCFKNTKIRGPAFGTLYVHPTSFNKQAKVTKNL